jgi:hypothetical protein
LNEKSVEEVIKKIECTKKKHKQEMFALEKIMLDNFRSSDFGHEDLADLLKKKKRDEQNQRQRNHRYANIKSSLSALSLGSIANDQHNSILILGEEDRSS